EAAAGAAGVAVGECESDPQGQAVAEGSGGEFHAGDGADGVAHQGAAGVAVAGEVGGGQEPAFGQCGVQGHGGVALAEQEAAAFAVFGAPSVAAVSAAFAAFAEFGVSAVWGVCRCRSLMLLVIMMRPLPGWR